MAGDMPYLVSRLQGFGTTIFAEMSALAVRTASINLGQGFPDTDGPSEVAKAAIAAIHAGHNQYPPGIGVPELRGAIAAHQQRFYGLEYDPDREVLVTAGATEAIAASLLALCEPGDEVVTFEPYYDSYAACISMAGARRRVVTLRPPDYDFVVDELAAAIGPRTRLVLLNSPHNPTGKVFRRDELELIANLCLEHDLLAFTDDIYEHIVYRGEHIPLATIPGMAGRTVAINSMSKTYSVTGWRVGWVIAPADLSVGIRRAHDFLTVGAAAPLQQAAVVALGFPDTYYERLAAAYRERRDALLPSLAAAGFRLHEPDGAYYVMTDIAGLTSEDDVAFALRLIRDPGVAAVPGSSFFSRPELGRTKLRFAFPKRLETLRAAAERLAKLATPV
jgi:N-succinyldiaminopimelate aminotransferase